MKKIKLYLIRPSLFLVIVCCFIQCELNINTNQDCLECTYKYEGRNISEELCDAFGTEDEKDEMRDRMQVTADSLDVTLSCIKH